MKTRELIGPRTHRAIYALRSYSWLVDPRRLRPPPEFPIDKPIFLLGTQGGGLTLLSRMLRRHPVVIGAAGNDRYWTAADEIQNVYGLILPSELTGLRYKAPEHPVLKAPRSWTYAARELYGVYRKRSEDATPQLAEALQGVIRRCAQRFAHDPQNFRFLDKSQVFTVRVGLIAALLKDSDPRFVLVPREPYISVYRAAIGKAADLRRLQDRLSYEERVDICGEHYANSMRAVFEDVEDMGIPLHILRFEDLIKDPEGELKAVCRFLCLDFQPYMLPNAAQPLPLGSRYLERWHPVKDNVNDEYEQRIDPVVIDAVNRHGADLLDHLGYRRR